MVSAQDAERIAAAVRTAEAGTAAELVCVLARCSSAYEFYPLVWAALIGFAVPWPLIALTLWSASSIFAAQLLVFLAALGVLSFDPLRMRLVPRPIARRRAHRAAAEQFLLRGLHRTRGRTGVLLFVSEAEHYARIIADDGVAARIEPTRWHEAVDLLVAHAKEGRLPDGFVAALDLCGALLSQHLPPENPPANELADRFYVV